MEKQGLREIKPEVTLTFHKGNRTRTPVSDLVQPLLFLEHTNEMTIFLFLNKMTLEKIP